MTTSETGNAEIFELYRHTSAARILMTFKGAFSQELLVELGDIIKKQHGDGNDIRKMFSVFVEMAQNILYYSAEKEIRRSDGKEVGVGIVLIRDMDKYFCITSGNQIEKERGEKIYARCEELAALGKEDLKALYHQRRQSQTPEGSKGAGLGLIDMMRKSDAPPNFELRAIDEHLSFFILNIMIQKV